MRLIGNNVIGTTFNCRRLFLSFSAINELGSAISYLCFIVLAVRIDSALGVALLIATKYLAIATSGLSIGLLSRFVNLVQLIRCTEIIRFILLMTIGWLNNPSIYIDRFKLGYKLM